MVNDLCAPDGGFKWTETAPQTTLIEEGGTGLTDTTKKCGVYYIDRYVAPPTDYFIYLGPRRMRSFTEIIAIGGFKSQFFNLVPK